MQLNLTWIVSFPSLLAPEQLRVQTGSVSSREAALHHQLQCPGVKSSQPWWMIRCTRTLWWGNIWRVQPPNEETSVISKGNSASTEHAGQDRHQSKTQSFFKRRTISGCHVLWCLYLTGDIHVLTRLSFYLFLLFSFNLFHNFRSFLVK